MCPRNALSCAAYGVPVGRSASHLVSELSHQSCSGVARTTDGERSDSAVKQILLTMNEKHSFIIEDLDDFHVVIKADDEYRVRRELEAELEKNTYSLE
ncbi:hypothetical protein OH76DRAFT_1350626 [Lentinus brumalis]|uniref:General transcription and DNA repair factor IIH subunit TFB5 n=2 Tax=Polyporaceae TaxID=5317 RepID=A0A371DA88_9APHY|nr:hypothetical protein OH76DRAFT_1350626 [Polyporus brumalis]